MKYLGHAMTLIGAILIMVGVFVQPWYIVETVNETINGSQVAPGTTALVLSILVILSTFASVYFRRRALIISESITVVCLLAVAAWPRLG